MLIEDLLWLILSAVIVRAVWRTIDGVMEGLSGPRRSGAPDASRGGVPATGVQMVRDPVCGTYVVPDHAVSLAAGSTRVFFCSTACRDAYAARPSTRAGRSDHVQGRTA